MRVPNMHDKKHQSGRNHRRDHEAAINIVGYKELDFGLKRLHRKLFIYSDESS
jgi:hypothetical protein